MLQHFEIRYSKSGITTLQKRMGFAYKKPILTPCKADVDKQEAFVKQYEELKKNLQKENQIYFMDGVHPQHNTIASYGWIKKGQTKQANGRNSFVNSLWYNGLLYLYCLFVFFSIWIDCCIFAK